MRIEEKKVTIISPGRVDEHTSTDINLDEGGDANTLTEEQKDLLLKRAFLPEGDSQELPFIPAPPRSLEEQLEIAKDIRHMYPDGKVRVTDAPIYVGSMKLDGPPIIASVEPRVTETSTDGSSDRIPPGLRSRSEG